MAKFLGVLWRLSGLVAVSFALVYVGVFLLMMFVPEVIATKVLVTQLGRERAAVMHKAMVENSVRFIEIVEPKGAGANVAHVRKLGSQELYGVEVVDGEEYARLSKETGCRYSYFVRLPEGGGVDDLRVYYHASANRCKSETFIYQEMALQVEQISRSVSK